MEFLVQPGKSFMKARKSTGPQDTPLWYTWYIMCFFTSFAFNQDLLGAVFEEIDHPLQSTTRHPIVLHLVEKQPVGDLIEGFGEVQQDEVSLSSVFDSSSEIIDGQDKLSITWSSFPKTMLGIAEDPLFSEVIDDCTVYNMFDRMAVREIGLKLAGDDLLPFLKMGTTNALFHADGTVPWLSEAWYKSVIAGAISAAVSFSNLAGMPSGPVSLVWV